MTSDDRPRSVEEAAEWFDKHPATIRRWVRLGWLDYTVTGQ